VKPSNIYAVLGLLYELFDMDVFCVGAASLISSIDNWNSV